MDKESRRSMLCLVDDPVSGVVGMLSQLPLEEAVRYLETISKLADRLGILNETDRKRIEELILSIPSACVDRAA